MTPQLVEPAAGFTPIDDGFLVSASVQELHASYGGRVRARLRLLSGAGGSTWQHRPDFDARTNRFDAQQTARGHEGHGMPDEIRRVLAGGMNLRLPGTKDAQGS